MRLFFLIFFLQGLFLYAQFTDDFTDGNFTESPLWQGDENCFIVDPDSGALWLNSPAVASEAHLFTVSHSMENASWQFSFSMGFNPSSANYATIFLALDSINISESQQCFYLILGSSDDNISLWQIYDGKHQLLIKGMEDRLNTKTPCGNVKVKRLDGGMMILETNMGDGWQEEGRVLNTKGFSSIFFGLGCQYTSTRSKGFWFDNFNVEGEQFVDTVPSRIVKCELINSKTIRVKFSREVLTETVDVNSFIWKTGGPEIEFLSWIDGTTIDFHLKDDYPNGEVLNACLNEVIGINGELIENYEFSLYFYKTQRYDLVFTEIMTKPLSSLGLPNTQYLELYNRGEHSINTFGFTLEVGYKSALLDSFLVFPGDYIILVPDESTQEWDNVENRLEIKNWPFLSVVSNDIVLRDNFGDVIAALNHNRSTGLEEFKQDGGWSIEAIDINNLSGHSSNWDFCIDDLGGTPGRKNSIASNIIDVSPPKIESSFIRGDTALIVLFSEPMDEGFVSEIDESWFITDDLSVVSCVLIEPYQTSLEICFSDELVSNKAYEMNFAISPIDLAGNMLDTESCFVFANPVMADSFDVVINELMFDPPSGGYDFVELYNRSDKYIDLSQLYLSRGNQAGIPESLVSISIENSFFAPGEYLVITGNEMWLSEYYSEFQPQKVITLDNMPNFVLAGGTVILSDERANIIDAFSYNEDLHHPLLNSTKGVSLERIDTNSATQSTYNWHSASADVGYASPGIANSQSSGTISVSLDDFIVLSPDIFTPNQDGEDDLLLINYKFEKPGYICTVIIYNRQGIPVRYLVNNELSGVSGFYSWDGLSDDNIRCSSGIYVVFIRCFHPSGDVREVKKTAVLGEGKQGF